MFFLARLAILGFARRLVRGGSKVLVAAAAAAAVRDDDALIGPGKIVQALAGVRVVHDGADRDLEQHVFTFAPGAVGTFTVPSALGLVLGIETEMDERVMPLAGFHDD